MGKLTAEVRLADEVWLVVALLHREHPDAADFTSKEIVARAKREGVDRPGVAAHVSSHCVANIPRDRGSYRLLFKTAKERRRLFRPGDPYDPTREGGKTVPERDQVPENHHYLLDWYNESYARASVEDPLAALAAKYHDLWKDVDADEHVRSLREGWE